MTDEQTPAAAAPSMVRRLLKPLLLVVPIVALVIAPAFYYGSRSRSAADEADNALMEAVEPVEGGGFALDLAVLCPTLDQARTTTQFFDLALDDSTHRSSVSGIGFGEVVVDLKGWADQPPPSIDLNDGIDHRDDITFTMQRVDDTWCVADIEIFGSE